MEKSSPHCPLSTIKELVRAGKVRATATAVRHAYCLGFQPQDMFAELLKLERVEFYKSMTSYHDHTVWQDVYRHASSAGMLYIKLTVMDGVVIVSFKEL
ncbi:MAG: type II toxin-antitoxin system MqsR family toxin [Desulfovibrio sp.]|nr:type II toxin-antitoxin system MqsR family toxin [Desulfovibrio sp.]